MRRSSARRVLGWALVAALVVAGVTAMAALATGSLDETDGRILGTSIAFGVFSSVAATGTDLLARHEAGLRALGFATALLAAFAFVLLVRALWTDGSGDEAAWKAFGVAGIASLTASHSSMVVGARRASDRELIDLLVATSIVLGLVDGAIGIALVTEAIEDFDEGTARWLAVLVVALLLTSFLPPVLRRVQGAPAPRRAAPVEIKVRTNGPYKVTGPIRLIDADGNEFDVPDGEPVVLCRCGASKTKPFCDKTHSRVGFEAAEQAARRRG